MLCVVNIKYGGDKPTVDQPCVNPARPCVNPAQTKVAQLTNHWPKNLTNLLENKFEQQISSVGKDDINSGRL